MGILTDDVSCLKNVATPCPPDPFINNYGEIGNVVEKDAQSAPNTLFFFVSPPISCCKSGFL